MHIIFHDVTKRERLLVTTAEAVLASDVPEDVIASLFTVAIELGNPSLSVPQGYATHVNGSQILGKPYTCWFVDRIAFTDITETDIDNDLDGVLLPVKWMLPWLRD